jgi:hypothetical protein
VAYRITAVGFLTCSGTEQSGSGLPALRELDRLLFLGSNPEDYYFD